MASTVVESERWRRRHRRSVLAAALGGGAAVMLVFFYVLAGLQPRNRGFLVEAVLLALFVLVGGFVLLIVLIVGLADGDLPRRSRRLERANLWVGLVVGVVAGLNVLFAVLTNLPAVALCLPTTGAALLLIRRGQQHRKTPWPLLTAAFMLGLLIASTLGAASTPLYAPFSRLPGLANTVAFTLRPGIFEELAKWICIALLYLSWRSRMNDLVSCIAVGAAVGIGFNLAESISDMGRGFNLDLYQVWYRQVLGVATGHATYGALSGAGLGLALTQRPLLTKVACIAGGLALATLGHFSWDFFHVATGAVIPSAPPVVDTYVVQPSITLLLSGPFTVVVGLCTALGLRRQQQGLLEGLSQEVLSGWGTVSLAEAEVLVSPAARLRERVDALRRGMGAWRWRDRLQRAQVELVMGRWAAREADPDLPWDGEERARRGVMELKYGARTRRRVVAA